MDSTQAAFDQANAGIARTQAIISQKLVRAPFDGELGVRKVEVGQYLTAGTQIVSLTDLSMLYLNFTVTEKDSGALSVGQRPRQLADPLRPPAGGEHRLELPAQVVERDVEPVRSAIDHTVVEQDRDARLSAHGAPSRTSERT